MTLEEIRRLVIVAMFSDDVLMSHLVLKGGNALSLVYRITERSSLDVDFSMENDFANIDDIRQRIFSALRNRFDSSGFIVFDERFDRKPSVLRPHQNARWGGYRAEFKIIRKSDVSKRTMSVDELRRNALVIGERQERVFGIDISKHEYCRTKAEVEIDDYTVYVYTVEMIALEKVRALCQQLPGYTLQTTPRARAQDFYDVYTIVEERGINLTSDENVVLLRHIFDAKEVPLDFLGRLREQKTLHEADWPSVTSSTPQSLQPFSFYFDYVAELGVALKAATGIE